MTQVRLQEEWIQVEAGTTIDACLREQGREMDFFAAVCDGELLDLRTPLQEGQKVMLIPAGSDIARLMQEKTLCFVIIVALRQLYPQLQVRIEHSLDNGIYCEFDHGTLDAPALEHLLMHMRKMIKERKEIHRRYLPKEAAAVHFEQLGMPAKAQNIRHRRSKHCAVDTLEGIDDYFYGHLCVHTGYLPEVYAVQMKNGCWFGFHPDPRPQDKLFAVCDAYERWGKKLSITNVPQLNLKAETEGIDELILMSEAKIERELVELSDQIVSQHPFRRFVLISGPSSAGKTTFSHRLKTHLRVLGHQPHTIAMDDFFFNRSEYPLLEDGTPDFESLDAVDLELLQETIRGLLAGKEMPLPHYNFHTGCREWRGDTLRIDPHDLLIMEGIHGLNPKVIEGFARDEVFRVYVNALTHLNLDPHTRIPTRDYRLIRRMVRDHQFRGYSAQQTLKGWKHVREGEDRYIYPYQEEADFIFNTSMVYEMLILKKTAVELLEAIAPDEETYVEAQRLLSLLQYFDSADSAHIPSHSILAEFVGNSVFF